MSKLKNNLTCGLALVALMLLALGSEDSETAKTREVIKEDPVHKVSAQQLHAEYKANEVAADNKYKNKTILTGGTVTEISKGIGDSIYVTLDAGKPYDYIMCSVCDEFNDEAAKLSKGMYLVVKGKCEGMVLGSVVLRGCIFEAQ